MWRNADLLRKSKTITRFARLLQGAQDCWPTLIMKRATRCPWDIPARLPATSETLAELRLSELPPIWAELKNPSRNKQLSAKQQSGKLCDFHFFLKKYTFCHINRHPEQYILVNTIFNYRFHAGLPGTCLLKSPQMLAPANPAPKMCIFQTCLKEIFLEVQNETCS